MPAKTTKTKTGTKRKTTSRKTAVKKSPTVFMNNVSEPVKPITSVCRSCHALPAGGIEITSLLLVVVFCLTAVLITAVYALHIQSNTITQLEMEVEKSAGVVLK